jgi:hypothetical protein
MEQTSSSKISNASTSEAISGAASCRASVTERINEFTYLQKLTADAVSARAAAAEVFAAETGVPCSDAAPWMGGWSFFAHCVGSDGDQGAAVMAAIRRLGFVAARHDVNDRHNRGATFYAKVTVGGAA